MTSLQIPKTTAAFQLKGHVYTLATLELHTTSQDRIKQQLIEMTEKAPHFFQQTPVVVDLDKLEDTVDELNLTALSHALQQSGMLLVAIRGGSDQHKQAASQAAIAWMPPQKQKKQPETDDQSNVVLLNQSNSMMVEKNSHASNSSDGSRAEANIIQRPVRSGQQIYSKGDLIVLGQVSEGAELLAGGHIHIYGHFRGRALAGVNGDQTARIFCNHFEAELVSICGQYKLTGKRQNSQWSARWGQNAQIYLDKERLQISSLS